MSTGRRAQPGVNAGPNTRLRRETGVNARHPSLLGASNLDDLWVRTSRLRRVVRYAGKGRERHVLSIRTLGRYCKRLNSHLISQVEF